jgi:uncharacterized membrane protein HdeD (DUF308 family)
MSESSAELRDASRTGTVLGVVTLILGLLACMAPLISGIAVSISAIATAFQQKPRAGWGWMLFGGIVSVILGALIWSNWPLSGAWAVGVVVGIRLISRGWAMIALGSFGAELASQAAPRASA